RAHGLAGARRRRRREGRPRPGRRHRPLAPRGGLRRPGLRGGVSLPRGPRLGLDVGTVRVGLAASDPDGLVATPVATLDPGDRSRVVNEVCERGATVVYVGLPRHLSGAEGTSAALAREYARSLAGEISPVEVRMVD